jgi:hypothetical protein
MNRFTKYDDLVSPWKNDQRVRNSLLERIKNQSQNASNNQNLYTEENITEEYYKSWL